MVVDVGQLVYDGGSAAALLFGEIGGGGGGGRSRRGGGGGGGCSCGFRPVDAAADAFVDVFETVHERRALLGCYQRP